MVIRHLLFYIFAIAAVLSGVGVITARSPVRSALFLVFTFFMVAGLWMLAQAEFLSLILVVVYVGAVMTLFLFVIMMINVEKSELPARAKKLSWLGGILTIVLLGILLKTLDPDHLALPILAHSEQKPVDHSNTLALGKVLYTQYALATELASLLLLVGIIAAVSLTHRPPRNCKTQKPEEQVRVKRDDRVRLIDMKPERE